MTAATQRSSSAPPEHVTTPDACTVCGHDAFTVIGGEHAHQCCLLMADGHGRCQPCALSRKERRRRGKT